jgi:glycosyltransferase involved in cell wall biosynthesis
LALKVANYISCPIRKYAIEKSDFCIAESSLFYEALQLKNKDKSSVVHLKKFELAPPVVNKIDDVLSIIYLGNIGNIYDFESLLRIIKGVEQARPVMLHIIGLGPKRSWLLGKLKSLNVTYVDHGASFDDGLKKDVLSSCWFGFNGFKQGTQVGLSYKSIDYLSYGVPLLNSLGSDTFRLVADEAVGFNFSNDNLEPLIDKLSLLSSADVMTMKDNAYSLFKRKFSGDSYFSDMDNVLRAISRNG